ncbi:hypothetical protein QBC35DRAFT_393904 [Podospora australis]|uniref:Rhodopsin domain-containing protein n=1 Tax=Podospora australis TaxID=1536484 RepID=A0AAN6WJT4_9PEZI|nr:hypothetical protein QBC35DRAFT_393904 [Podospora australis]
MAEIQEILTTTVTPGSFLAAVIVLVTVPALFVAVRIGNNYRHVKGLYLDDWFSIFAVVLLAILCALYYIMRTEMTDPSVALTYMGRIITAVGFMAVLTLHFAKVPILILYLRLFGVNRAVRITSWILLTIPLVLLLGAAIYGAAVCSPEGKNNAQLDLAWQQGCMQPSLGIGVWNGSVSVLVDIIIFVLPLPVISKLKMNLHKKIGLLVVFLAAFLGIAASGITLYFRGIALAGRGLSGVEVGLMLGHMVECSIAIIVGCAPALRWFRSSHINQPRLSSGLQSAFSNGYWGKYKRSHSSMDHRHKGGSSSSPGAASSEQILVGGQHHDYIALDEVKVPQGTRVVTMKR